MSRRSRREMHGEFFTQCPMYQERAETGVSQKMGPFGFVSFLGSTQRFSLELPRVMNTWV